MTRKYFWFLWGYALLATSAFGQPTATDLGKLYVVDVPKGWAAEGTKEDIDLKLGQVTIHVYAASDKLKTLDAVMDDIVQFYSKQGISTGSRQRLSFPGGQALWAEAPGTERPYLGAVSRGGKFFFVNAEDKAKNSSGVLEAFLAAVRSVRPASSVATSPESKPGQKPAQTAASPSQAKDPRIVRVKNFMSSAITVTVDGRQSCVANSFREGGECIIYLSGSDPDFRHVIRATAGNAVVWDGTVSISDCASNSKGTKTVPVMPNTPRFPECIE